MFCFVLPYAVLFFFAIVLEVPTKNGFLHPGCRNIIHRMGGCGQD